MTGRDGDVSVMCGPWLVGQAAAGRLAVLGRRSPAEGGVWISPVRQPSVDMSVDQDPPPALPPRGVAPPPPVVRHPQPPVIALCKLFELER